MRKLLKGMLIGNLKTKAGLSRNAAKVNAGTADESRLSEMRERNPENDSDVDARAFNSDSDDNGFNKRIKTMKRLKGRPQMPFRIGKRSLVVL